MEIGTSLLHHFNYVPYGTCAGERPSAFGHSRQLRAQRSSSSLMRLNLPVEALEMEAEASFASALPIAVKLSSISQPPLPCLFFRICFPFCIYCVFPGLSDGQLSVMVLEVPVFTPHICIINVVELPFLAKLIPPPQHRTSICILASRRSPLLTCLETRVNYVPHNFD